MSRWTANFENQQNLPKVEAALQLLARVTPETIPATDKAEYDRLFKALSAIKARLAVLDPELYPLNFWTGISSQLQQIQFQLNAYATQKQPGYLTASNGYADELVNALKPMAVGLGAEEVKIVTEANIAFQKKIQDGFSRLQAFADGFKDQLDALQKAITQGKSQLDENNVVLEKQKSRLDEAIAEFQKQFSTAQDTRSKDFLKALDDIKTNYKTEMEGIAKSFATASEAQKKEWSSLIGETTKQSGSHLDFLQKRKKEVDDIFGAIGQEALAGHFNDVANQEGASADTWRKIAFALFCVMGAVAIATVVWAFWVNPQLESFLFRLGAGIILCVPAFYAANESSKHRNREKLARKNFLELSAIDAYLVHLPEQDRNQIKGKLSEKFFGVPEIPEKDEVKTKDVFGFVEKVVKDLTKGH